MKKYSYFHKPEYSHSKLNLNHEKHKYSVSSVVSEEGLEPPIKRERKMGDPRVYQFHHSENLSWLKDSNPRLSARLCARSTILS